MHADLTNATADEFARFWFDREVAAPPAAPSGDEPSVWYDGGVEIACDPTRHADNFAQLFSAPERLHGYTPAQLEEGFWAMWSGLVKGGLATVIWSNDVPWEARERVIRSMVHLFKGLFATEPLETASYMWWDMIVSPQEHSGASLEDAPKVHRVMFEVVCEILEIEAEPCQRAALHGLNHLRHPDAPGVIHNWLDRHPDLDPELRAYADECARFAAQ